MMDHAAGLTAVASVSPTRYSVVEAVGSSYAKDLTQDFFALLIGIAERFSKGRRWYLTDGLIRRPR